VTECREVFSCWILVEIFLSALIYTCLDSVHVIQCCEFWPNSRYATLFSFTFNQPYMHTSSRVFDGVSLLVLKYITLHEPSLGGKIMPSILANSHIFCALYM